MSMIFCVWSGSGFGHGITSDALWSARVGVDEE